MVWGVAQLVQQCPFPKVTYANRVTDQILCKMRYSQETCSLVDGFSSPRTTCRGLQVERQKAPCVCAGMNVPECLQPCGVTSRLRPPMSVVDNTPRGKATGVRPWYGVHPRTCPLRASLVFFPQWNKKEKKVSFAWSLISNPREINLKPFKNWFRE